MRGRTRVVAAILIASLASLHPAPAVAFEPPVESEVEAPVDAEDPRAADETRADLERASSPADVAAAEAQRHFIEGQALYQEGKYDEAAAEFRRSYVALPTATALYNMALAEERAGDAVAAVRSYRDYLKLDELAPERRAEVEGVLQKLGRRVGEIDLQITEGMELREIRVDDRVIPEGDFPLLVVPGEITLELVGMEPGQRRVRKYNVDGGQRLHVEVYPFKTEPKPGEGGATLDPTPRPVTPPPVTTGPDRAERRARITRQLFWGGLVLTGAGGVAVGVLGGLAKRAEKDFNRKKCATQCDDPDMFPFPADEEKRAKRLATGTNVAIGVTAGLGVVTAVLGIVGFSRRPRGKAATRVSPAPGGLSFRF